MVGTVEAGRRSDGRGHRSHPQRQPQLLAATLTLVCTPGEHRKPLALLFGLMRWLLASVVPGMFLESQDNSPAACDMMPLSTGFVEGELEEGKRTGDMKSVESRAGKMRWEERDKKESPGLWSVPQR